MSSYSRPFWPLFLHVIGAMTLVGAVLTAFIVAWVAWRRPGVTVLARTAFSSLVFVAVPAYVVMRVCAQVIDSTTRASSSNLPELGQHRPRRRRRRAAAPPRQRSAAAYWWLRSGKPLAGRIVAGLSSVYLVLLAIAWLAMSGKWG